MYIYVCVYIYSYYIYYVIVEISIYNIYNTFLHVHGCEIIVLFLDDCSVYGV